MPRHRAVALRAASCAVALLLSALSAAPCAGADGNLHDRVDRAIERGRVNLERELARLLRDPPREHTMGRIALPLTALLKAGAPESSVLVRDAFDRLAAMAPAQTYDVACYLFALDALTASRDRAESAGGGRTGVARPPRASGKTLQRMLELVEWLVEARVRGKGVWSYGPSRSNFDYSNCQFAILGLHVGIENGIRIPKEIFLEIANQFRLSGLPDGPATTVQIVFHPPIDQAYTRTYKPKSVTVSVRGTGWNYHGDNAAPYPSMTAAGVSSLLVARNALARLGGLGGALEGQVDSSIRGGMAWIARNFNGFIQGQRHYYYTLYSLEKAGDIGDVLSFGAHDWYAEGAAEIVARQQNDGGWGGYVDTSFALLFLTRATRSQIRALPPPTILTATGKEKKSDGDLVYVDELDAFISAREFLAFLARSRRSVLLVVAEQVVRNYSLERQADLVPPLVGLIGGRTDAVAAFARKALETIAGARLADPEDYLDWHAHSEAIDRFAGGAARDIEEIRRLLAGTASLNLKSRVLDIIEREHIVAASGALAEELRVRDAAYRARVHAVLVRFTGQSFALGASLGEADLAAESAQWSGWWKAAGKDVLAQHRIRELVEHLNAGARSGGLGLSRRETIEALVKEGRAAVPAILDAIRGRKFRFDLVIVLERVSGQARGFDPESWRVWWRESGG